MPHPEYTRISNDAISDDSSIIDFNNNNSGTRTNTNTNTNYEDVDDILDNDDIPLLNANRNHNQNLRSSARMNHSNSTIYNQPIPLFNSASLRNFITKKIYWNMCVIILITIIPYIITIYSYLEMRNSHGIDIYNLNSDYMYYYFFAIMLFYTFYIGISFIILFVKFWLNLDDNTIGFALLANNMIFQTNMIIRIIAVVILGVRMIDNTPMNTITIDKTNPPAQLDIYIPKHVQYMVIETIIYAFVNYMIGESSGIIKMITTY